MGFATCRVGSTGTGRSVPALTLQKEPLFPKPEIWLSMHGYVFSITDGAVLHRTPFRVPCFSFWVKPLSEASTASHNQPFYRGAPNDPTHSFALACLRTAPGA